MESYTSDHMCSLKTEILFFVMQMCTVQEINIALTTPCHPIVFFLNVRLTWLSSCTVSFFVNAFIVVSSVLFVEQNRFCSLECRAYGDTKFPLKEELTLENLPIV